MHFVDQPFKFLEKRMWKRKQTLLNLSGHIIYSTNTDPINALKKDKSTQVLLKNASSAIVSMSIKAEALTVRWTEAFRRVLSQCQGG